MLSNEWASLPVCSKNFLMIYDPAFLGILEGRLYLLANVKLVHDIVPIPKLHSLQDS
jgi:hypothetical protein